jgi:phage terminase large subunit-like protein
VTGYLDRVAADTFDWAAHLARWDPRLLLTSEGRREACRYDPLLFALLYFRHHLRSTETGDSVSFSDFHLDLCRNAYTWARTSVGPMEERHAWVAPRGSGKSTWCFGILPAWAMAYQYRKFVAAFADSAQQAQQHLASLKREFDTNELLRRDFPDLCRPAYRPGGQNVADNQGLFVAKSGVAFLARGIDSSTLGAKISTQRPDLILFDDVEPDESNYSGYQKDKRLATIVQAVLPMNLSAVVLAVGTVVMPDSIMHDLVKQKTAPTETPAWVAEEKFRTHYYPALVTGADGERRSLWPQRWSTEFLQGIEHTASYKLNFANDPMGRDGGYWTQDDFRYGIPEGVTRWLISVDPGVTEKRTSDPTGIAVVGFSPHEKRCVVAYAAEVRLVGKELRLHLLKLLERFPLVRLVLVESNQGGDHWHAIFHDLPVKLKTVFNSAPKHVRAADLHTRYQRGQVVHAHELGPLERQMIAFPKGAHDDMIDAVGTGASRFLDVPRVQRVGGESLAYT